VPHPWATTTDSDSRATAQFFRNALHGENIVLKSAGKQLRSYCYVADCASAVLTVLTSGTSGEAYNIANPENKITIAGLAETIAKAAGKK
jgi:nucleoside-diphosphate-sugar epimerase